MDDFGFDHRPDYYEYHEFVLADGDGRIIPPWRFEQLTGDTESEQYHATLKYAENEFRFLEDYVQGAILLRLEMEPEVGPRTFHEKVLLLEQQERRRGPSEVDLECFLATTKQCHRAGELWQEVCNEPTITLRAPDGKTWKVAKNVVSVRNVGDYIIMARDHLSEFFEWRTLLTKALEVRFGSPLPERVKRAWGSRLADGPPVS